MAHPFRGNPRRGQSRPERQSHLAGQFHHAILAAPRHVRLRQHPAGLEPYYAPYHALDFGFIGDTTASLIWRLDHGQVDGLNPRLTIILIGTNNLGRVHWGASETIPGIESVVTNTHRRLPDSHILLLGVLPSIRSPWVDEQTILINAALAQHYAGNSAVTFMNVSPLLMKAGRTDASLYVDPRMVPPEPALHPDATGMARIAAYIQPVVQKYAQ